MSTHELEDILKTFFRNEELPGSAAQKLMAPSSRNPKSVKHSSPIRLSAVMLLLYPKNKKWHIALIKRNTYNGNHSAQVSLPGGKLESGDADLKACALRETYEEVGVYCEADEVIGSLTALHIPISNFMVHPYVLVLDKRPDFRINPDEVEHLIEIPLKLILKQQYQKTKEIISEEHHITAPVYQLENDYIWGATAMILSEFAVILKHLNLKF